MATIIISASRRTDRFRNVFGGEGQVSMRTEDVLGYLFWTRDARPFRDQLKALREEDNIPYVFQYTITGLGQDLEPQAPRLEQVIADFHAVSRDLPDSSCIQWRYDPIVLSDRYTTAFHRTTFAELACALDGATRVVNTSVVEPYMKAIRRVANPSVCYRTVDPDRHKSVVKRHPGLSQVGKELLPFLQDLAGIAAQHGMELRSCCNPEWELPPSQCCGVELFAAHGRTVANTVAALSAAPSRNDCRCLKTVDIGMDNTCVAGCKYCYAVGSHQTAVTHYRNHDPAHSALR
jgi:hypothetical protein